VEVVEGAVEQLQGVKDGDPVVVKVTVQPERGKATKRALELLSERYGKRAVLVSGMTSRNKIVELI